MSDDLSGLFEQLDFSDVDTDTDLLDMETGDLILLIRTLDAELALRGELMDQTTQEGRDMHSRRGAAMVVLRNRQQSKGVPDAD